MTKALIAIFAALLLVTGCSSKGGSAQGKAGVEQRDLFDEKSKEEAARQAKIQQEQEDLKRQMDEINRKYADAVNKVGTGTALPPALTNELSAFAQQNPQLVKRAVRALMKSHRYVFENKKEVVPQMIRYLEQKPEVAERSYDLLVTSLSRNGDHRSRMGHSYGRKEGGGRRARLLHTARSPERTED